MRSLKNFSIIIMLAFCFPLAALGSFGKVCLTGRVVRSLPSYGQSFINAAYLAVKPSIIINFIKQQSLN